MGKETKIEWCDHTFNPWIGCTKVSDECAWCYAESLMDTRYGRVVWGKGNPRQRTSEANWRAPIKWDRQAAADGKRRRVFCASLGDVFDDEVPVDWLADLLTLIDRCPHLDWLLLTKRPQNVTPRLTAIGRATGFADMHQVWLGASVGRQGAADERIPILLSVPSRIHFVSYEPALEAVDFSRWLDDGPHLDWIIVGGESGGHARPFELDWARSTVNQCRAAGVAVFVKQLGARPYDGVQLRLRDRKGGNIDEFPAELQVRQFPVQRRSRVIPNGASIPWA